jgi:hypothetical protein
MLAPQAANIGRSTAAARGAAGNLAMGAPLGEPEPGGETGGASSRPGEEIQPAAGDLAGQARAIEGLAGQWQTSAGSGAAAASLADGSLNSAPLSRAPRAEFATASAPLGSPTPRRTATAAELPAGNPETAGSPAMSGTDESQDLAAASDAELPEALGPQAAALPGDLVSLIPVETAESTGPRATTPGMTSGPRRVVQGEDEGPALSAEIGAGPRRRRVAPGLPRGLTETSEPEQLAAAEPAELGELDVPAGQDLGGPRRREGGVPVQIAARPGPGGLSTNPSPLVGVPDRRARPEADVVHQVSSRFVMKRSAGTPGIDARAIDPTEPYKHRDPNRRSELARARGGTEGSEAAVEMGLDFLARHQYPDGHWALDSIPEGDRPEYRDAAFGQMHSDTGATGLALLTFLGAGYTHLDDKHRDAVGKGIQWLLKNQQPNGQLFTRETDGTRYARIYAQGIATIALCEAYGMTQDPNLRDPARKAIQYILEAQHPTRGGWRYTPKEGEDTWRKESDTSVSGWQLMALKSAQMAGIDVPQDALARVAEWLDRAQADAGARYIYNPYASDTPEQRRGRVPNLAMTAEGLLMRLYLGWDRNHPATIRGADHLVQNLPEVGTSSEPLRDVYYWYYATQVMFHVQGEHWTAWNDTIRPLLESSQVQAGPLAGSWNPDHPVPDRWAHAGGRHYVTALNLLMLEVYYRHLPLFETLRNRGAE